MLFFYADSIDVVDPNYCFDTESSSNDRVPQLHDEHAHEYLESPPYDGVLVSRAIVGGAGKSGGKYSQLQRNRLYTIGIRKFLRCQDHLRTMGDSGAFTYSRLGASPFSTEDLTAFYEDLGFDLGVSADHLIAEKKCAWDDPRRRPDEATAKAEQSVHNAVRMLDLCKQRQMRFTPIGAVQGWSPRSLAHYARKLSDRGFQWLGLGGLSGHSEKTTYDCIAEVRSAIPTSVRIHVFGLSPDSVDDLVGLGVDSFDTSSPMLRAVKDAEKNYFIGTTGYAALRIPRLCDGPRLLIPAEKKQYAEELETKALAAARNYPSGEMQLERTLTAITAYEEFIYPDRKSRDLYRATLADSAWKNCPCRACVELGVDVVIHRGMNRNKRRGFHNLYNFYQRLVRMRDSGEKLRVPCIRAMQGDTPVYSFVVDGKQIQRFASVSRATRDSDEKLVGYQRPEVSDHIREISEYLSRDSAILPNSIVIAFRGGIEFIQELPSHDTTCMGRLQITLSDSGRPGWIVDGQQRVAALRSTQRNDFPVSIVAFESTSDQEEREQFVLVNNTRPLPKSLVYEMLPEIDAVPPRLLRRQHAYSVLELLNRDPTSAFHHRIATSTAANRIAPIKDVSILRMIENSFREGLLTDVETKPTTAARRLDMYWGAVQEVYPEAWDAPPRMSRLTHGTGIVSMGYLMDAIATRQGGQPTKLEFRSVLETIGPLSWMEGSWRFSSDLQLPWNELQNTGRHIDLLTNHLIRRFRKVL